MLTRRWRRPAWMPTRPWSFRDEGHLSGLRPICAASSSPVASSGRCLACLWRILSFSMFAHPPPPHSSPRSAMSHCLVHPSLGNLRNGGCLRRIGMYILLCQYTHDTEWVGGCILEPWARTECPRSDQIMSPCARAARVLCFMLRPKLLSGIKIGLPPWRSAKHTPPRWVVMRRNHVPRQLRVGSLLRMETA